MFKSRFQCLEKFLSGSRASQWIQENCPVALEEHGWGRSVKVWKAFVKGLRTPLQALLSEQQLLPTYMLMGGPINYEKKSITNCGLHPLLSQNQGVIWLGAIYKKKGKLKKIKIEGRLIPPSLRRACEAPGKCEREKNPKHFRTKLVKPYSNPSTIM